jgi:hypothetical protein
VDWHEISAYAIKNETIRSGSKNSKICHLSSASRPSNPVKHLRQRQGATGDTWSGNIAPRMADGSSSRGPHPARPGYMCCRACTAESTAPRSTVRFKLIPEGPCAKAGARYEGAPPVHGPHANSRWLCDNHQQAAKRSASKSEAVIVDIIPPSALPADRFCTVRRRHWVHDTGRYRQCRSPAGPMGQALLHRRNSSLDGQNAPTVEEPRHDEGRFDTRDSKAARWRTVVSREPYKKRGQDTGLTNTGT